MTLKKIWLIRPPDHFLIPEFDFFFEELWDAVGFDFRFVFIEPFGRPRLACGFDFFGEVFTANDVPERRRPTSVETKAINVDHQDKGENHFILVLCLYLC